MFEKLLNAKICKLQAQLTAKYGETAQVAAIIQELDKQARNTMNTTCFDTYKAWA